MFLDKSRVPVEKLADPRLQEWENDILEIMQDPSYRGFCCVHEAGHAVYYERAGAKRLTFHGPVALYCAETDEFDFGGAAVEIVWPDTGAEMDLLTMARAYVAGGVVARTLTTRIDEDADGRDHEDFIRECQRLCPGITRKEISEHWEQAKKNVEIDLRKPALRRELWRRAKEFENKLLDAKT
jgi:hypothetical protein